MIMALRLFKNKKVKKRKKKGFFKRPEDKKPKINIKYLLTKIILALFFPLVLITLIFRFFFSNKKKL